MEYTGSREEMGNNTPFFRKQAATALQRAKELEKDKLAKGAKWHRLNGKTAILVQTNK